MFGSRFFNSLAFLELRLNILVLRIRFASKLIESNRLIDGGLILVNGSKKTKNYIVRLMDIIKRSFLVPNSSKLLTLPAGFSATKMNSKLTEGMIQSVFLKRESPTPLFKKISNRVVRVKWSKFR